MRWNESRDWHKAGAMKEEAASVWMEDVGMTALRLRRWVGG